MKTMKNKLALLVAAFAFVLVFAPTVKAEAAVRQTDATATSVTIEWDATSNPNVAFYGIYLNGDPLIAVESTSYKIEGLSQGVPYSVIVASYTAANSYIDMAGETRVRTTPKALGKNDYVVTWSKSDKIKVEYVDSNVPYYTTSDKSKAAKYIDGIEFELKDVKGKNKKTLTKTVKKEVSASKDENFIDSFSFTASKALKNKGMQYRFRTYIQLNGKKVYSDWSGTKVIIPQAKLTGKLLQVSKNNIKIKWKKVSGAKGYTIYRTTNGGKSYKKVKKVGANVTSYTVSNFKKGTKNGVVVVANGVKVGKKKYDSTKSYYTYYK